MTSKDQIITLPNKALRRKSKKVAVLDQAFQKVLADMKAATLDWEASREHEVGVALAAIQIDKPYRVVIIRNNFDDKSDHSFSKVPRHSKVRVRAKDETGRTVRVKAEGFLARVFQHEIDHTNGQMFVDYIKDKPHAFFKLTDEGKLEELPYEDVKKTGILR
jgi:peptide deformylase